MSNTFFYCIYYIFVNVSSSKSSCSLLVHSALTTVLQIQPLILITLVNVEINERKINKCYRSYC